MADQEFHPFLFSNQRNNREVKTLEGIYEESTYLFGTDVVYVKRTLAQEEPVFGEFLSKVAEEGVDMRLFVEQVEQFDGADMYSKFGLTLSDEMSVYGPKVTFEDAGILPKPQDLVLHVPSNKLFEITHVADDREGAAFYPLGDNFSYKLSCKIYAHDYSETEDATNIPEIIELDAVNDEDIALNNTEIQTEGAAFIDTDESDPLTG
jgi:hypothetical protein